MNSAEENEVYVPVGHFETLPVMSFFCTYSTWIYGITAGCQSS